VIIVDTTVWTDYFRGSATPHTDWLDAQVERQRFGLLDLLLCEVLQGIQNDRAAFRVQGELKKLEIYSTGGTALAVRAAENYRRLRGEGHTVRRTINCLIATYALNIRMRCCTTTGISIRFENLLGLLVISP
jgi:predicted nucleic acid-binding protein